MRVNIDFKNYTDSDYEALCFFSIWNSMRGLASGRNIIIHFSGKGSEVEKKKVHDRNWRDVRSIYASRGRITAYTKVS